MFFSMQENIVASELLNKEKYKCLYVYIYA